jgi:putative nucleotidyltransferase with HDIG domain
VTVLPVRRTPPSVAALRIVREATDALSYEALIARAQQAETQGRRRDARELYEVALCRLRDARRGAEASDVLRWIARTYRVDADLDLALECADAALAVAEAHRDLAAMGHATNLLAIIHWQQGDLDEAERLYHTARENALEAGEAKLGAMTAQNLGVIANIRGDLDTALRHYEASLAAYRQLGLAAEVCLVLNNLGLLFTQREHWADAARAYEEALRVADLLGDQSTKMHVEVNRAEWSVAQGDFGSARQACVRAMSLAELVRDAPALGEAHKAYGIVEREGGDFLQAEQHLAQAFAIATARQDMLLLADTTKELAELHRRQGRNRDALQYLNRAHRMFTQLRARRELADIDRRLGRLESDFLDVARRWGESIECNDDYTQGHCERVAGIACALAEHDGMDEQSLFWFRIGALLHDVGKLVIPPGILDKRAPLTPGEWALMRSHPTAGVEMLAEVEFPWDVSPIVEGHHERWDGQGYPHGLAGEAIPRVARMVCIADVYDALTSERSYKKAMTHEGAMAVMRADVGRQFDPGLFAQFEAVAQRRGREWTAPARAVGRPPLPVTAPGVGTLDELTGPYEAKRRGRDAAAFVDARAEGDAPAPQLGAFMARGDERRRLVSLLQRAGAGEPQIVSIVGEGGVGKSALVRELAPEVRLLGGSFVAGRCADSDARAPYWPWSAAISAVRALPLGPDRPWPELSRTVPPVGTAVTAVGESGRLAFFEAVSELLRLASAARPFVLLLDDMQWADAASWDLLEYVVSHLERERLLVCLTMREEESGRDVVRRRTRMSRDERFHELRVTRLTRPELSRWVEQAFRQAMPAAMLARVYGRSEGNPFFTVQVLRAMLDERELHWTGRDWGWRARGSLPVPIAVTDLLRRRLARLSPGATRTLGAAAALGRRIDLDLAVSAGLATEAELLDAIDEGLAARVLEAATGDEHATFSHGLLLELLHEEMHPRRLRRLRERVAQTQAERAAGLDPFEMPSPMRDPPRPAVLSVARPRRPGMAGPAETRPA